MIKYVIYTGSRTMSIINTSIQVNVGDKIVIDGIRYRVYDKEIFLSNKESYVNLSAEKL